MEWNWIGSYPYLWLDHALVDNDSCTRVYLQRHDIPLIENWKNEDREQTMWDCYQKSGMMWIFHNWQTDLHSDFGKCKEICHELVSIFYPVTPEKYEEKINYNTWQFNCVIMNWEGVVKGMTVSWMMKFPSKTVRKSLGCYISIQAMLLNYIGEFYW